MFHLLAEHDEATQVVAANMVAYYIDLPTLDDGETIGEWIAHYGPTIRGAARVGLLDMLATMDRVSVTRGATGTDLLAWAIIGAADTWSRVVAVPAMVPTFIIDREPATPRVRNRKGASAPDARRSRRPDHASRAAMELAHAANDILASAGQADHHLLGGLTWMPREVTPDLGYRDDDDIAHAPVIDAVGEGWRKRPCKARRTFVLADGSHRFTERITVGERTRVIVRDDDGKVIEYRDVMPRQRKVTRRRTDTGIIDETEQSKARRSSKARMAAARGSDLRAEVMAAVKTLDKVGAVTAWRTWTITLHKAATARTAARLSATTPDGQSLLTTPRSLATALAHA